MYTKYYGLTGKPFSIIPDPETVYMSDGHQEALAILRYGVIDRKGFLLLTGGVGTGKTTLLQLLLKSIDTKVHCCMLANPTLSVNDFYYYLAAKYGLREFDSNKAKFMLDFADFLKDCRQKKERVLLIIDEAHAMPVDLLEEIRLLSNQEYHEYGVMSIFLVGQPELNDHLADERLLPLRQRIGIRYHLQPFSLEDTEKYILFRLTSAGCQQGGIFSPEALQLIHKLGGGVPRLINIICDQALLTGFAEGRPVINGKIIQECGAELQLQGEDGGQLPVSSEAPMPNCPLPRPRQVMIALIWFVIVVSLIMVGLYVYEGISPVGIITKVGHGLAHLVFVKLKH